MQPRHTEDKRWWIHNSSRFDQTAQHQAVNFYIGAHRIAQWDSSLEPEAKGELSDRLSTFSVLLGLPLYLW